MKRSAHALKAFVLALVFFAFSGQVYPQTGERNMSIKPVSELPAKGKRWALVIGVDQYHDPQINRLVGAANDARVLADALIRYAGFPPDQVFLLATDQPQERQPTRVNILRRLYNLTSLVPEDGLLLVSFAGHGIARDEQHAYLLPSDAQISDDISFLEDTAISVERVRERIRATGVRQVLVLLDACRNDPASGRAAAPNVLSKAYTRAFNFDVSNREVVAFATIYATAVGQRAYEYGEKKQGYFTWALVEGMKGGAANEKGEVTLEALVEYIQKKVPERTRLDLGKDKQQKPWADIKGYLAEELVVAVAQRVPPPIIESTVAPRPTEPSDADDGFKAPDDAMKRPSSRRNRDSLRIGLAGFDCYARIDRGEVCHLGVYGRGWGVSDVKVIMNGQDVSKLITSQDESSIQLEGDRRALNFLSGRNEVVVRVGESTSNTYAFIKVLK